MEIETPSPFLRTIPHGFPQYKSCGGGCYWNERHNTYRVLLYMRCRVIKQQKISLRFRLLHFGYFERLEDAQWVSDFVRYLGRGMNPALWHRKSSPPNGPPRSNNNIPRAGLIAKLLRDVGLKPSVVKRRMDEFDAIASANG
jgi:hypothetical protein